MWREGIVGGDEGPIGGVAQVIGCHGVKVGDIVHGEEGQEEDGEVRGEVEGEGEENQGQRRHMDGMRMEWQTLNSLEPIWSDESVTQKTNICQRAGVLRPRACCACAC